MCDSLVEQLSRDRAGLISPSVVSVFTLDTGAKIPAVLHTGNEAEVGQGTKDSGVPPEEIRLTTKLDNNVASQGRGGHHVLLLSTNVIPKSVTAARIEASFELDGWELSFEEVRQLSSLKDRFRVCGNGWLPVKIFFGDDE
ncbi:hypothetical protein B0A49_00696 [Cryomyces minteri]|uniref:Uncharacterized protein n=1 Tax=Cryomyces minteri TaxID=331657 RepID=A0A4U0XSE4_9PEZI|nr:hypothetical protein B0A49_00696 [Cryomyces minteri]